MLAEAASNLRRPGAPPSPPAAYQRRRDLNVERLNACEQLIAPSDATAAIFEQLGVDRSRIAVQRLTLPHLERLKPRPERPPGAPLTFVTLGGCASRSKGSRVVAEAVQTLDSAGYSGRYRLIVLGWAEPAVRETLAASPSVTLHGPYAPEDLDRLLDGPDIGILPSIWDETHGFVGIEMLAKGLPVIGSALGGITEYVIPGITGWLNSSATGAELAEIMIAAIEDSATVERLQSLRPTAPR